MDYRLNIQENHQFEGFDGNYLFHPLSLNLFRLDRTTFEIIKLFKSPQKATDVIRLMKSNYPVHELKDRLESLIKADILFRCGSEVEESSVYPDHPIVSSVNSITLYPAESCNMSCKYCLGSVSRSDRNLMKWEVAKKAVDMLFEKGKEHEGYIIAFFGGEPLLNFPLIKNTVLYARAKCEAEGKKVSFSITTNGTLITDEIADFLVGHDFSIAYSMDGGEEIHNANRIYKNSEGSFNDVVRNFRLLKSKGADIIVQGVVNNFETNFQKIASQLKEEGVTHYKLMPEVDCGGDIGLSNENLKKYSNSYRDFLRKILLKSKIDYSLFPQDLFSFFRKVDKGQKSVGACSSITKQFSVGYDGKIYPCENFAQTRELLIGDVFRGYDNSIGENLSRINIYKIDSCKKCWCRYLCGGPCPYFSYIGTGKFEEVSEASCKLSRENFELSLGAYGYLKYRNKSFLKEWRSTRFS